MIVCALPRSGGTIFAKTLAENIGAVFTDEFTPYVLDSVVSRMGPAPKHLHHEIKYNVPAFDIETFSAITKDFKSPNWVTLVNNSWALQFIAHADYYLARRSLKDWMFSIANYQLKYGQAGFEQLKLRLLPNISFAIAFFKYCDYNQKQITFYEDTRFYRQTDYANLNAYHNSNDLKTKMRQLIEQSNLLEMYPYLTY